MWENILFWGVKLDKICYILQIIQNYNSVKGPYGHCILSAVLVDLVVPMNTELIMLKPTLLELVSIIGLQLNAG